MVPHYRMVRTFLLLFLTVMLGASCSEEKVGKYPISSQSGTLNHTQSTSDIGARVALRQDFRNFIIAWAKQMNSRFKAGKVPEYVIDAKINDVHVKHIKHAAYGRLRASLRLTFNGLYHPKSLYRHLLDSLKDVRTIHLTHVNESRRKITLTARRTFYGIYDGKRWALYRTLAELRSLGVSGIIIQALADTSGASTRDGGQATSHQRKN